MHWNLVRATPRPGADDSRTGLLRRPAKKRLDPRIAYFEYSHSRVDRAEWLIEAPPPNDACYGRGLSVFLSAR